MKLIKLKQKRMNKGGNKRIRDEWRKEKRKDKERRRDPRHQQWSWSPLSLLTRGRGSTNQPIVSGPLHLNSNEVHLGIYESLTSVEATIFLSYSRRWVLLSLLFSQRRSSDQFFFASSLESSSRLFSFHPRLLTMHRDFHFFLIFVFSWWLASLSDLYLLLKIYFKISR